MAGIAVATGVTSRGVVLGSGTVLDVLSGGTALGTVVSADGAEAVFGTASGTAVGYGGSQIVFGGGTAIGSLVDGALTVSSGGVTSGVALIEGVETVSSGGVASGTVVAVSSGGVPGNGQILVLGGGTMRGVTLDHDGYAAISTGGVAVGTILSGGDLSLGGGTAIGTTIGAGGVETVSTVYMASANAYVGGVTSATVIDGGTLDLAGGMAAGGILFTGSGPGLLAISGTAMPATAISGFGVSDEIDLQSVFFTSSGAVSFDTTTDTLTVTEGGSSLALTLAGIAAGTVFTLGPDALSGTTIEIGTGNIHDVSSGVTSAGLVVSGGGMLDVLSGGTVLGAVVGSRGLDEVLSGGIGRGTVVSADGAEAVFGLASGTAVGYGGSQIVFGGGTAIGSLVDGALTVSSGGVTSGAALIEGVETVSSGGVASGTVVAVSSGGVTGDGDVSVLSGGTAAGAIIRAGGFASISAGGLGLGAIVSGGDLEIGGGTAIGTTIGEGGLADVFVTYVFSTGDYNSGVASATVIDGGTLDLAGGMAAGGILFTGSGPGLLAISGTAMPATAISGFGVSDEIDLRSLAYTESGTVSLDATTDGLTVTEGGSSLTLALAGIAAGSVFDLSPDTASGTLIGLSTSGAVIGTANLPCFAAGTRIETARGAVAVEDLAIGDRVARVEGDMRPITWIGSRRVDCRRHPRPAKVWPVLIAADAFAPGVPMRDLRLSPDHALFAEGVLIPVKHLIDGFSIRQVVTPIVTYFHLALEHHAVLMAESLPVESYLDTGDRTAFSENDGLVLLHPSFGSERADIALVHEALGYAPLRVTGPEVVAVKARLARHATRRRTAAG